MITKKDLNDYNFESMTDYYNYIIESRINGQFQQVRELIQKLSYSQYVTFVIYCTNENIIIDSVYLKG